MQVAGLQTTARIICGNIQGSGAILGQKDGVVYILTAWHLLAAERKNVEVAVFTLDSHPNPSKTYPAALIGHDEKNDLALLSVKTTDKMPGSASLCPSKQLPPAGEFPALACGSVGNHFPSSRVETVLAAKKIRPGMWRCAPGKSISPSLKAIPAGRSSTAKVVCWESPAGGSGGRGYCSHTDEIRAFLVREKLEWLAGD